MKQKDLENVFRYHKPNDLDIIAHGKIRDACKSVARIVLALCPDSRERDEAVYNLELASMWANASIARHKSAKRI